MESVFEETPLLLCSEDDAAKYHLGAFSVLPYDLLQYLFAAYLKPGAAGSDLYSCLRSVSRGFRRLCSLPPVVSAWKRCGPRRAPLDSQELQRLNSRKDGCSSSEMAEIGRRLLDPRFESELKDKTTMRLVPLVHEVTRHNSVVSDPAAHVFCLGL